MPSLDVFQSDAFGTIELTAAINKMPFVPGFLGSLGIFEEEGVTTTSVMVEEKNGTLSLVQTQPRGAPANQNPLEKRTVRSIVVPHLPIDDRLVADSIQNVRAFGQESELETVQGMVNQKLMSMARRLDATIEYHRIGAIKGTILDADGSTLLNLFTAFNVAQESEVDFDLDAASPASGALMKKCNAVLRLIEDNLEMGPIVTGRVIALCSSEFYDDLVAHTEIREAQKYLMDEQLRMRTARRMTFYGGIEFHEYRGTVGGTSFIAANKAHIFPVVAGLFKTYYAPADYMETVNTLGLPRYAKQAVDQQFQKYVDMEAQTNPLNLCLRPKVLIQAKRT